MKKQKKSKFYQKKIFFLSSIKLYFKIYIFSLLIITRFFFKQEILFLTILIKNCVIKIKIEKFMKIIN